MSQDNRYNPDDGWGNGERERLGAQARREGEQAALEEKLKLPSAGYTERNNPKGTRYQQAFKSILKGSRNKSPIVLILIALLGGGSIFTAILAPGTVLLSLADTLERDLNSQLSALDNTSNQLWRTKLKQTTSGSCGAVVLRCKFKTINVDRFEKSVTTANTTAKGHLKVEYDKSKGWGDSRGKITSMTWTDENGKTTKLDNAKAYTDFTKNNVEFRKTMLKIYNPRFHAFKTQTAIDFLAKNKTSYSKKLQGKDEKEVRASKSAAIKGEASIDFKQLKPILDDEGKETGRYQDPDSGRELSQTEVDSYKQQETRIKTSPPTSKLLKTMATGAAITGALDTACTLYNTSRAVVAGAKVLRQQEEIRYGMIYINEAHAMRAELSTPETVGVASDDVMYMEPKTKVADESKLAATPAGQALPMIDNPNGGKTGLDSPIYKMSSSQDYPKNLDAQTQALLPGGGFTGTLASINNDIAHVLGSDNPKELSERCKIIQNPYVRTGALVIGVAAGIGTFGASTAASIGASSALAFALPYLTAQLAGMAAGNVTEGLKGIPAVSAMSIGAAAMFNGMARSNGLMTLSPAKMASYQNRKRETLVSYDQIDQQAARENPFDITNQFSFVGSLARTSLPITAQLRGGGAGVISALSGIASQATLAVLPTTSAADTRQTLVRPERYAQCKDPDYQALGADVAVDVTCVMVFGLPDEAMDIDPLDNLEWMLSHDEIDPMSEDGNAKDNGQDWNYQKYLTQCVDQQPGIAEDPEANPTNGAGCASPANYEKNWHYAKFKTSVEVNKSIDQDLPGMEGAQEEFSDGSSSAVSASGWAYPTDKDATRFTSGFGPRGGEQHNGVDLAGPLGTPIYAARDGEVVAAGPASGFGNWIVIRHEVDGKRVDTVYGHMSRPGVLVRLGDKVKAGQQIGKIGNEGQSTGPHLHFEVWDGGRADVAGGNGTAIDPKPIVDQASQATSPSNSSAEVRV